MVQILNTGAGVYNEWKPSSFDPVEAIKEAGQRQVEMEKYKQGVLAEREKDFLKSIDIKTENMMYNSLQGEMKKKLDEFTNFAVGLEKKSNGNLSLEDKLLISQKKREVEQWRDDRLNVAQQLVKKKQIVFSDWSQFDRDRTQRAITEEENNILTVQSISTPVMRFEGMHETFEEAYKKIGADGFYTTLKEEEYQDKAGNKKVRRVQSRIGLETEEKRDEAFKELLGDFENGKQGAFYKFARNISNDYESLMDIDKQSGTSKWKDKYPTMSAYAWSVWRPSFGAPRIIEDEVSGKVEKPKASDFNKDTGSGGGYDTTFSKVYTNTDLGIQGGSAVFTKKKSDGRGIVVRIGQSPLDANGKEIPMSGDDAVEVVNATKDKWVVKLWKGADTFDKAATDRLNTKAGEQYKNPDLIGSIISFDKVKRMLKQDAQGNYYFTKELKEQPAYYSRKDSNVDLSVAGQIASQTNFGADASSYIKWLNEKMDKEGIGSSQPKKTSSQGTKTIRRKDIASKASAAGYSVSEYTKLLEGKGIQIED